MVELLIKHGAKINFKKACTPLEKAAIKGNAEIVKVLIKNGAELESKNIRGQTPLYLPLDFGNKEVVKNTVGTWRQGQYQ